MYILCLYNIKNLKEPTYSHNARAHRSLIGQKRAHKRLSYTKQNGSIQLTDTHWDGKTENISHYLIIVKEENLDHEGTCYWPENYTL